MGAPILFLPAVRLLIPGRSREVKFIAKSGCKPEIVNIPENRNIFFCIPESSNSNISHQLFNCTIKFVNSQHWNTNSKGGFVLKNWF